MSKADISAFAGNLRVKKMSLGKSKNCWLNLEEETFLLERIRLGRTAEIQ